MRKAIIFILNILFVFLLVGCGKKVNQTELEEPETTVESIMNEEVEEKQVEDDDVEENSIDILQAPSKDYGGKPFEPKNKYYIVEDEDVVNDGAEYGNIKQEHEEFSDQNDRNFFYYDMECFYFDETYPAIINETLQTYYNAKKETYHHDSETYDDESYKDIPSGNIPFDSLIFYGITYVGDDFVSLLFNDVSYAGGAHPYSVVDGITIDCSTGEIVTVNRFIDDSDEVIEEQITAILGEAVCNLKEWDYYITDKTVVFFYYDPRFWEWVATKRTR